MMSQVALSVMQFNRRNEMKNWLINLARWLSVYCMTKDPVKQSNIVYNDRNVMNRKSEINSDNHDNKYESID